MILQAAATTGTDPSVPMSLAILENDIAKGDFEAQEEVPTILTDSKKTQQALQRVEDLQRKECKPSQTSRPIVFIDSRTVHQTTPRQNETG